MVDLISVYSVSRMVGYFLPMVITLVLAMIFANKVFGWPIFAVGTVFQFLSLFGNTRKYSSWGLGEAMTGYWVAFAVVFVIGVILIKRRRGYGSVSPFTAKRMAKNAAEAAKADGVRFCPECGGSVKDTEVFCPKCHHKM